MHKSRFLGAALAATLFAVSACSEAETDDAATTAAEVTAENLTEALSGADNLSVTARALTETGLGSVFEGPASYTVFAPNDAAFGKLGDAGAELMDESQRAVLIAVLRNHMAAGHLTPEAIRDAIDLEGGSLQLRTLGDSTLTFTKDGDNLLIDNGDGVRARMDGAPLAANNGVIIPLDTVVIDTAAD